MPNPNCANLQPFMPDPNDLDITRGGMASDNHGNHFEALTSGGPTGKDSPGGNNADLIEPYGADMMTPTERGRQVGNIACIYIGATYVGEGDQSGGSSVDDRGPVPHQWYSDVDSLG
jgi:hypothetical protein